MDSHNYCDDKSSKPLMEFDGKYDFPDTGLERKTLIENTAFIVKHALTVQCTVVQGAVKVSPYTVHLAPPPWQ